MGILLISCQVRIMHLASPALPQFANHQHVRIIVSTWCRGICTHIPFVSNITCSTPLITSCFSRPIPDIGSAITYTKYNITFYLIQSISHNDIRFLNGLFFRILFNIQITAIVILQVIHSPAFPSPGINFLMLITAYMTTACGSTRRRINTEFQS